MRSGVFFFLLSVLAHGGVMWATGHAGLRGRPLAQRSWHEVEWWEGAEAASPKALRPARSRPHRHVRESVELPTDPSAARLAAVGEVGSFALGQGSSDGGQNESHPRLMGKSPKVRYPRQAYRDGLEGDVVLYLHIDEQGNVTRAELVERAGHGFDEAALEAAFHLKFSPATQSGRTAPGHAHHTFHFRIEDAD